MRDSYSSQETFYFCSFCTAAGALSKNIEVDCWSFKKILALFFRDGVQIFSKNMYEILGSN